MMPKKKLSPKEERFCREHVIDLNGAKAAIRAGYAKKAAKVQATRMLTKVYLKNFIKSLQSEIKEKNEDLAQMVVDELKKLCFSNVQDYIGKDNEVKDISKIDPLKAAAISSIKKSKTEFGGQNSSGTKEVVEFKLWDKVAALEKIGRHLGIFEADNRQQQKIIKVSVANE